MRKSTVFTVFLLLVGMAAYSFGWVQTFAEAAAQYVKMINNDAVRLGLLACIASVLMLPAFLYLHYVTQSVKNMTAAFQKLTQSHQSCCDFQHHRLCSRYADDVKSLRDSYKNVRQAYVMAAVLCQVIIFGCMFEIVKAVPFRFHTPPAVSMGLAVLLILYLLFYMRTYLMQFFQHGTLFRKVLVGVLTGAGIWWMLSFTISELLFLIILAAIQQIGSFIYKRLSYRSSASLDL
ncbi:bacteriocin biosynthesis protein AlbG [Bacillus inaquosorum]|uniref:bacteriocin biosynthesis protein AlbG n=1 Tax=Bacillus inaquosorum TaxID=483913 RepID=UPI0022828494|nr:bacteriocin biosynthesis protein AlbG [Bacillus inaquosorum]MCY7951897.1 bacteriocin biosynthesis protein AlbG [Bacillus inaquosorum]MEC0519815.1 bacteriocin biosynthesis protein AlbG [Bacillus inaquosorum]MEC0607712.1 bacteriocin biosynthesis protein AlbG [Bacillus inaquosorum]